MTDECGMVFNVVDVAKPLASAVKVTEANNMVVWHPGVGNSYIQSMSTGECVKFRKEKGTFVFDVEFTEAEETGTITLDSGAGVSVWPKKCCLR